LDSKWYASRKYLARTIKLFGMTNEEYFLKYGKEHMSSEWRDCAADAKYCTAKITPTCLECMKMVLFNETKWSYPKFCSFSCSAKWHATNTDRVEQAQLTMRAKEEIDPDFRLRPNQLRYWTNQGLSEEEAKEQVSIRQRAGSLQRMTEKYGEEEGVSRFNTGLANRKMAINKSDMFKGGSKVATDLFRGLAEGLKLPLRYGAQEDCVWCPLVHKNIWVDCLYEEKKKIIEFYGTYWHASPRKYKPDDILFKTSNKSAKDIWRKDQERVRNLRASGFEVLIIWEDEYTETPEWAIDQCMSFLCE
jgi:hypothetical protein